MSQLPHFHPPDIKHDRVYVAYGASMFSVPDVHVQLAGPGPVWISLVPMEASEAEKEHPGKIYPRERMIRVDHALAVGTVDELVQQYREGLERAFASLACLPEKEGDPQPNIPVFGEPSLRKQNEVLQRNGITTARMLPLAPQGVLEARQDCRNDFCGCSPRQTAFERNRLEMIVAPFGTAEMKRLIKDLQIYIEDEEALNNKLSKDRENADQLPT